MAVWGVRVGCVNPSRLEGGTLLVVVILYSGLSFSFGYTDEIPPAKPNLNSQPSSPPLSAKNPNLKNFSTFPSCQTQNLNFQTSLSPSPPPMIFPAPPLVPRAVHLPLSLNSIKISGGQLLPSPQSTPTLPRPDPAAIYAWQSLARGTQQLQQQRMFTLLDGPPFANGE